MCKCYAFKGALTVTMKLEKWGGTSLLTLNFYVLLLVFPTFSAIKVVHHEYPFAVSVMSVMP